jgi:hypothetical protein
VARGSTPHGVRGDSRHRSKELIAAKLCRSGSWKGYGGGWYGLHPSLTDEQMAE